jgi:beta-phosphoglucomutase
MELKNYKAVLFDFDGVLADTMEDNFFAWKKSFLDFGIDIKREDYFPLEGMKLIEVAKKISHKYNLQVDPSVIMNLKNKYYLEINKFSFYPGIEDLIEILSDQILIGLVSASPRKKLEKTVPTYFLDRFNVVISGDDTENGKPSSEPYLSAMKKLNVSPEDTVVVENAPLGIKSAKSAGAYCIAIATTLKGEYLKEADKIVNNHEELKDLFGQTFPQFL